MVSFGEKAKIKKAGNMNSGLSYPISTVIGIAIPYFFDFIVGLSGSHVPKQPSLIAVHAIGRKRD